MNWTDTPVTILGLSKSGMAAARYLAAKGARCFLSETVPASPSNKAQRDELAKLGVEVEMGGHSAKSFSHADLVIVSPGIPPTSHALKELGFTGKTIISEVELAYRESQSPMIAVTGTNGKTTTTTLISEIIQAAGKSAPACGNIGTPIIDCIEPKPDVLVAELSSYQLQFSPTLKGQIAVMMNFTPDHLDWHGSLAAYKRAKLKLFTGDQSPEWAVLNADDPVCVEAGHLTTGKILWFSRLPETVSNYPSKITVHPDGKAVLSLEGQTDKVLFQKDGLQIKGKHNLENALASAAAASIFGISEDIIATAIGNFKGVEHRLEPISTPSGITFYNDSKATNPEASISALKAFEDSPVILIAGGRDKKTDLTDWISEIKAHARHVILIGEASVRFRQALTAAGYTHLSQAESLPDAVAQATAMASSDVPVLFSPACASFDMFTNFEVRGAAFKNAVAQLSTSNTGSMSL